VPPRVWSQVHRDPLVRLDAATSRMDPSAHPIELGAEVPRIA
jgi:hypothetical protein